MGSVAPINGHLGYNFKLIQGRCCTGMVNQRNGDKTDVKKYDDHLRAHLYFEGGLGERCNHESFLNSDTCICFGFSYVYVT